MNSWLSQKKALSATLLDRFPLKGSLLRTGKRIFRLERVHGRSGEGIRTTLNMGSLFARRLKLLRFPAQSAYLYRTCCRDEITSTDILSRLPSLVQTQPRIHYRLAASPCSPVPNRPVAATLLPSAR